MVFSLLAYFFSMITAFAVMATVSIGLIGDSPFQRIHVPAYPMPAVAEVEPAMTPAKADDTQAEVVKVPRLAPARNNVLLAPRRQEQDNTVALGYAGEPSAAFSPAFASPSVAPIYPAASQSGTER